MRTRILSRIFFGVATSFSVLLSLVLPASALQPDAKDLESEKRVVIVSMPRLTWETFQNSKATNIDSIISRGSIGTLSVRVLGAQSSPSKGYATISAGNRSTAANAATVGFVQPDELYDAEKASDVFGIQRGKISTKNPAALGLNFEMSLEANRKSLDNSKIGSFAQGLSKDSKSIAIFGNADSCLTDSPFCFERSIAYVGTNDNGVLKAGDVSRELLSENSLKGKARPSLDFKKMTKKVGASIEVNDVTVAECSDMERIDRDRKRTKVEVYERDFISAVEKCDAFIGSIINSMDLKKDQIYILSPSSPREKEETTFFAAAGDGIPKGYASSSTTRIKGAVTLVDIAPSILEFLGANVPDAMNGSVFDWRKSQDSSKVREDFLISMNERAVARDETLKPTVWFMVFVFAFSVIFAMIAFTRKGKWVRFAEYFALLCASLPLFTFILQPAMAVLARPFRLIVVLFAATALFAFLLSVLAKKIGFPKMLVFLSSSYLLVEIGDILTGGRLQFNSIFGNATLVAGRFAGFNNQSFALLSISMILFVAMVKQYFNSQKQVSTKTVNFSMMALMFFILIVDGAPQFGSDVGGVLALTPTIFVVSMMLFEKRIKLRSLLLSGVATAVAIGAFTLVDLSKPEEKQTHLGRYADQLFSGDGGLVIERKLNAALRSFTRLDVTVIVLLGVLFLIFAGMHSAGLLKRTNEANYGFKFIAYPGIFLGILGTLLNDSGVTIPALMMLVVIPAVVLLIIDSNGRGRNFKDSEVHIEQEMKVGNG